jgi:hypothetical protein
VIIRFTGTQHGMAPRQRKAVAQLFYHLNPSEIHLGDCVGADSETYDEAIHIGISTIGHPAEGTKKRAFRDYDREHAPKPPLVRNSDIAHDGVDGLIAAPKEFVEVLRSGTWATVRYARKLGRRIWIVRPDGKIIEENVHGKD